MPEVSLVAILDADKEGYLRSAPSLIQTIGRAARHLRGKAILYADRVTASMQAALDETARRRAKQTEYNALNGITPTSVARKITDVMEGARAEPDQGKSRKSGALRKVAEPVGDYRPLSPDQLAARLKKLEAQMYQHAKDLEFEAAAKIRDEMKRIRDAGLLS